MEVKPQEIKKLLKNNLVILIGLLLLTFLLFYKTLQFSFIADDFALTGSSKLGFGTYGIYWGHPASVIEFFLIYKLFGANIFAFNIFGILLRALTGFVSFLFISKLTNSKSLGIILSILLITSYVGLQSTTWASAQVAQIDLILVTLTSYLYLIYLNSKKLTNFIIFSIVFLLSLVSDIGRNFPLVVIIFYLFICDLLRSKTKNSFKMGELKGIGLLFSVSFILFIIWYIFFGYFFGGFITHHHTRIPFDTFKYFFGSLANLFLDPLLRTFEFSADNQNQFEQLYIFFGVLSVSLWVFVTYRFIKLKSNIFYFLSVLLFWMFIFYLPSWFSYPRIYVPATHRYLTAAGFGFIAIIALIIFEVYKKNKQLGSILFIVVLLVNLITLNFHINQENSFRSTSIASRVWTSINKEVPKNEKDSMFYLKGNQPLLTWGLVWSSGAPLKILRGEEASTLHSIEITENIEKIANYLCLNGITSLPKLKEREAVIPFHAWYVFPNGVTKNITVSELVTLENLYKTYSCVDLRKKYGSHFNYW